MEHAGCQLYNDIVLINSVGTAAIRAGKNMHNRKITRVHQSVLVFYKGDIKKIKDNFPAIDSKHWIRYMEEKANEG
ncbi:MAG: hypothetical protein U9Q21_02445 [Candidatus Auribacterota bacterium]|nr:hypothetical protein [Candidatus Auribacterota bacterium]